MTEQEILKRLRNKIFSLVMGILVLPVLIILLLIYQNINYNSMIKEGLGQEAQALAHRIALNLAADLKAEDQGLQTIGQDYFEKMIGRHYRETLYILDHHGKVLYANEKEESLPMDRETLEEQIFPIALEKTKSNESGYKEQDAYGQYGRQMIMGYASLSQDTSPHSQGTVVILAQTSRLLPDESVYRMMFFFTIFIGGGIIIKLLLKFSEIILQQFIQVNQELQVASEEADDIRKKLLISEKLAAMGRVTSGIAHEIGNPLASISSMCQILERPSLSDQQKQGYIEKIKRDISRIDKIIKEFLAFSSHQPLYRQKIAVNEIVKASIHKIPDNRKNPHVILYQDYDPNLPMIYGDAGKLEMVFSNIFLNAFQVLEEEGSIFVRSMKKQNKVQISIKDTGGGIDSKDIERIFDPFYTTKPVGKGSGLGLYICQQIIEAHGGSIKVITEPEVGTEFIVRIPIHET